MMTFTTRKRGRHGRILFLPDTSIPPQRVHLILPNPIMIIAQTDIDPGQSVPRQILLNTDIPWQTTPAHNRHTRNTVSHRVRAAVLRWVR